MQEFNSFYPHLVLYDREHFCPIWTDLGNFFLVSSKAPFAKLWSEECSYKTSFQKCRSSRLQMFFRSSHPEVFCKRGVLRNFTKFTGKHLCWSPFLIQLEVMKDCSFNKKGNPTQVFSCEYHKVFKNSFFMEHLWWLLLNMVEEFLRISNSS